MLILCLNNTHFCRQTTCFNSVMEHGFIAATHVAIQLWFQSQLWLLPLLICSATTTDPQLICRDTEEERESTQNHKVNKQHKMSCQSPLCVCCWFFFLNWCNSATVWSTLGKISMVAFSRWTLVSTYFSLLLIWIVSSGLRPFKWRELLLLHHSELFWQAN